ncbi:uncharacterized protein LOC124538856 [Vanessa cardui]|uniref:uncharacterized protein LOC124538856 n=1 Tax=Vanessa cardui TaxID=171605 RepID=UPI001F12F624|nr:uncharacterized protein LOC124538856 [Vanessa cardui]
MNESNNLGLSTAAPIHLIIKMKVLFLCVFVILINFKIAYGRTRVGAGSRCVNMWDEGCINGQLPGSGRDDDYINGGFNPGKRCINMWDEGCMNGQLIGSGRDDDYINGGFNPGKRCIGEGCDGWLGNPGSNGLRNNQLDGLRITNELLARLYKNRQH